MHGRFESRTPKPLKVSFLSNQYAAANNPKTPMFPPSEYYAKKAAAMRWSPKGKMRCNSRFDQEFLRQQEAILLQIAEDSRKPAHLPQQAPHRRDHPTPSPLTGSVNHLHSDSDESNYAFCNFLTNEEMIREQRRILDQIQRERSQKQEDSPRKCRPSSSVDILSECLSDTAKVRQTTLSSSRSNYLEVPRRRQQQQEKRYARTIVSSLPKNNIKIN
jgi:hypothetical protein